MLIFCEPRAHPAPAGPRPGPPRGNEEQDGSQPAVYSLSCHPAASGCDSLSTQACAEARRIVPHRTLPASHPLDSISGRSQFQTPRQRSCRRPKLWRWPRLFQQLCEFIQRRAILKILRHSGIEGHSKFSAAWSFERFSMKVVQQFPKALDAVVAAHSIHPHDKFIAVPPGQNIFTAKGILKPATDRFEHVISGGMAELVVDFSQMFHIDDSQTKGLVVSLGKIDEIGKDLARF